MTKNWYGVALGMIWLPLVCLASGPTAGVAADCEAGAHEMPLATETGSVGVIKNLAEDPTSIRAVAARLLASALRRDVNPMDTACEAPCVQGEKAQIIYRVTPIAYLATELQREECRKFESETRSHPLTFNQHEFHSVEALNEWITAFSQGRGEDGRLLYQRCSSNCSPRYTFLIAEQNSRYAVRAEVLCGLARDKSNDVYRVSTALRRVCTVN